MAADGRAKAKQHSELTALHLASALKEVINRNNHPGAAACPGRELGSSSLDRGVVPPSPGAEQQKADSCKKPKKGEKRRLQAEPGEFPSIPGTRQIFQKRLNNSVVAWQGNSTIMF